MRLPEGTRELTVPPDFRFTVDGKSLAVSELKPGMSGTATITTKTTTTPVTVTEVKNGTVTRAMGTSIIVATDGTFKMFSQSDIDKRGVKIMREGKPAEISDFRENDRITATIITPKPPRVMTEKEVNATLAPPARRLEQPSRRGSAGGSASGGATAGAEFGCGTEADPAEDREPVADARRHWARLAPRGARPQPPSARHALTGYVDTGLRPEKVAARAFPADAHSSRPASVAPADRQRRRRRHSCRPPGSAAGCRSVL